jgi:hypothetical protein
MREFKFRAWHKKESRYLGWNDLVDWLWAEVDTDNLDHAMQDFVIQQYTGLKDENGKEIYEGDIIEWQSVKRFRKPVVFSDGVFWAKDIPLYEVAKYAEVIGNMCENRGCLK